MSFTSGVKRRQFVDSNLLVYSLDLGAGDKQKKATALLDELWKRREGCTSMQVLQEFYVTVTAKIRNRLAPKEAAAKVARFAEWTVHEPGPRDLLAAIELQEEFQVSFWDAMILQSARKLGCGVLWTEDLSDGQIYAGVNARNPFLDFVME